jgi:hypothetical protein
MFLSKGFKPPSISISPSKFFNCFCVFALHKEFGKDACPEQQLARLANSVGAEVSRTVT